MLLVSDSLSANSVIQFAPVNQEKMGGAISGLPDGRERLKGRGPDSLCPGR